MILLPRFLTHFPFSIADVSDSSMSVDAVTNSDERNVY